MTLAAESLRSNERVKSLVLTYTYISMITYNSDQSNYGYFEGRCYLLVPGSNAQQGFQDPSKPWIHDIPPAGHIDGRLAFLQPVNSGIDRITLQCSSEGGGVNFNLTIPLIQ
jgi:hypothetical protein